MLNMLSRVERNAQNYLESIRKLKQQNCNRMVQFQILMINIHQNFEPESKLQSADYDEKCILRH